MSMTEAAITATPDVSSPIPVTTGASDAGGSSPSPTPGTGTASQPAGDVTAPVQDNQPAPQEDPLAGIPSADELRALVEQNAPNAKGLKQLREAYEKRNSAYTDLESRFKVFEPVADKFTAPEELQSLVDMREGLMGWEAGDKGQLIPSTQKFAESLDQTRADFLFADLAEGTTVGRDGQEISRIDKMLQYAAADPERRANALRILGGVEPSAVAPQWQATAEQLDSIAVDPANLTPQDKELQDIFRSLPYDEREQLATNEPDFIRRQLGREKLTRQLEADKQQSTQLERDRQQQAGQLLQQEATAAGETYVDNLLATGLTTFHNSVVEQCNFIAPLDLANLPQGMSPEQATAMNAQIAAANKAEAAQITSQIVALINPQTRRYMLPTLKEIGVVDDKLMADIDKAANAVGDNGRNYGHLLHQHSRTQRDYRPGPDVTPLDNEAQRSFKLLVHYANQIKGRLMEKRSQFFAMKATGHNAILNGAATSRPSVNGGGYDPATATTQRPTGWASREELERQYG